MILKDHFLNERRQFFKEWGLNLLRFAGIIVLGAILATVSWAIIAVAHILPSWITIVAIIGFIIAAITIPRDTKMYRRPKHR